MLVSLGNIIKSLFLDMYSGFSEILVDMKRCSDIDYCEGVQLTNIATKTGSPIPTTVDAELRIVIKGNIASKNSNGNPQDMASIIEIMSDNLGGVKEYRHTLEFFAPTASLEYPEIALTYIRQSKPCGVKVNGIILTTDSDFILSHSLLTTVGGSGDKLAEMVF